MFNNEITHIHTIYENKILSINGVTKTKIWIKEGKHRIYINFIDSEFDTTVYFDFGTHEIVSKKVKRDALITKAGIKILKKMFVKKG